MYIVSASTRHLFFKLFFMFFPENMTFFFTIFFHNMSHFYFWGVGVGTGCVCVCRGGVGVGGRGVRKE